MYSLFVRSLSIFLIVFTYACSSEKPLAAKTSQACLALKNKAEAPADDACLQLHVPSPDWRDQIIYFAMIDRFADGDPSNNDQGAGVYSPDKESHYSGGDLAGLRNKVDYIRSLGATAVWITPPVANMWWDPRVNYSGYHGYWARNFKEVDEHYGTLSDYQRLSHALHKNGMYLIQDIVVNHMGNYFWYEGPYDPSNPKQNFTLNTKALPGSAPTQTPFSMVDIHNPQHFKANIFNWTPEIADFSDYLQETRYQTSSLSDLNTRNPEVIEALKSSYAHWIEQVGVDAFRVDTAKYVEAEFYQEFLYGAQGINEAALKSGRDNFFTFGEVYNTSAPYQDEGERKLKQYVSSAAGKRLDSAIGFPLYKDIQRVFASGAPTDYLRYRVEKQMTFFDEPLLQTNFIDNHDVERFLAGGDVDAFKLAYAFMMTAPGIPVIYQGDEQLFTQSRRSMFAGGYLSDGDAFDQNSDMFNFIRKLSQVRRQNKVFSRGNIEFIQSSKIGPGVLFYKRRLGDSLAYVLINTASHSALVNTKLQGFKAHQSVRRLLAFNIQDTESLKWGESVLAEVPPKSAQIFITSAAENKRADEPAHAKKTESIAFNSARKVFRNTEVVQFEGNSSLPNHSLAVVIDGKVSRAPRVTTNAKGQWRLILEQQDLGRREHSVELYSAETNTASLRHNYEVIRESAEFVQKTVDPLGDDSGPDNTYRKPLHESIGCEMDIVGVSARSGGSVLELDLRMCAVSDMWAPSNFFDHVAFSIYFQLPSDDGQSVLPLIGGNFPKQGRWHLAHVAYGWGNTIFSHHDANSQKEGTKITAAPIIFVDKGEKMIRFRYPGRVMGVESWEGVKIYITTWDKDGAGNYRPLEDTPKMWTFGSKNVSENSAVIKILDDAFIELK